MPTELYLRSTANRILSAAIHQVSITWYNAAIQPRNQLLHLVLKVTGCGDETPSKLHLPGALSRGKPQWLANFHLHAVVAVLCGFMAATRGKEFAGDDADPAPVGT